MSDRIARKIREIRAHLGLNQAEFAEKLGVSQGSVSKWESGREVPRGDTLTRISQASGLNVWALVSGRSHGHGHPGGVRETTFVGNIQHGYAVENVRWDKDEQFSAKMPYSSIWQDVNLSGWIIKGISPWPQYPSGTAIISATEIEEDDIWPDDIVPSGFDFEHGDIVVVGILKESGLREVTLKRYVETSDYGLASLWPLDGATDFTRPIECSIERIFDGDIEILGLVVASLRYEASPERLVSIPDA